MSDLPAVQRITTITHQAIMRAPSKEALRALIEAESDLLACDLGRQAFALWDAFHSDPDREAT